jgi:nicotinate-nucleotide pyrophosphorylase (carboxylating)
VLLSPRIHRLIELALDEDRCAADYTTLAAVPAQRHARGVIVAREDLVVCGLPAAAAVFSAVDPAISLTQRSDEGAGVGAGGVIARVEGAARSLLTAERTALNFLGRLCGVATLTARWVARLNEAWKRTPADRRSPRPPRLVDTRKTLPGWRELDKYAVRTGGGSNHRHDLAGGVLIKDNHLLAAGGVRPAVEAARTTAPHSLRLEVEVTDLEQLEAALDAGAEICLLDNMRGEALARAVERCRTAGVLSEVSGGVDYDSLAELAALGPDFISAGSLTHSAPAADLALDFLDDDPDATHRSPG